MNAAKRTVPAVDTVKEFWQDDAPKWVNALADYCDENSQAAAARKIGRSPSLVNQVLKNRYTGDLSAVQSRVEAAFVSGDVVCPILGQLSGNDCLNQQGKPYAPSNHLAVSLFRACRKCPHNIKNQEKK